MLPCPELHAIQEAPRTLPPSKGAHVLSGTNGTEIAQPCLTRDTWNVSGPFNIILLSFSQHFKLPGLFAGRSHEHWHTLDSPARVLFCSIRSCTLICSVRRTLVSLYRLLVFDPNVRYRSKKKLMKQHHTRSCHPLTRERRRTGKELAGNHSILKCADTTIVVA